MLGVQVRGRAAERCHPWLPPARPSSHRSAYGHSRGCVTVRCANGNVRCRLPNSMTRLMMLRSTPHCRDAPQTQLGVAATSWVATTVPGVAGTPGSRPTLPGARQGVGLGSANAFRDGGTGPAAGTGPRSAGLGCSGAGREQCGVPAAPVPPHPSQPLYLARRPASPTALLQQPRGLADPGKVAPQPTHSLGRHEPIA